MRPRTAALGCLRIAKVLDALSLDLGFVSMVPDVLHEDLGTVFAFLGVPLVDRGTVFMALDVFSEVLGILSRAWSRACLEHTQSGGKEAAVCRAWTGLEGRQMGDAPLKAARDKCPKPRSPVR